MMNQIFTFRRLVALRSRLLLVSSVMFMQLVHHAPISRLCENGGVRTGRQ